ncbi:L,D-transpeptidase catalytic domain [Cyclobacterium lianum]|uniref:L,D-transpeptidase catalytic domain n=2 Tax=Cyclobacterium lianum TaxID=388280 RepID=A0A1M7QDV4_9BACT|nr:L,D-transpeptidase catalytic domain [Cyclobacterium lianum]
MVLLCLWSPVLSFGDARLVFPERIPNVPIASEYLNKHAEMAELLWQSLQNEAVFLKREVLEMAVKGYFTMAEKGLLREGKPLSVIDFDLPSSKKRLWIIDMKTLKLRYASLVAHGRKSGELMAKNFSNIAESHMSSLGFYLTGETYSGKHGASLRLDGLEKGINDQARSRAIVIHSADYAEPSFLKAHGRLGRSLGCPALPREDYEEIIALIKDKSCLFIHSSQAAYRSKSVFLGQG